MTLVSEPGLVAGGVQGESQPRRRGYASYVGVKVLGSMGSLLFMLLVNFFLFRVLPGDPARSLGRGRLNSQAQLDAFGVPAEQREVDPLTVPLPSR